MPMSATRSCKKIMPDPVCVAVLPILIMSSDLIEPGLAYIEIDGRPLNRDEIEAFAALDGFDPERLRGIAPDKMIGDTARETMSRFWAAENPGTTFHGVIIRWEASGS
jgi:hypothetical protein